MYLEHAYPSISLWRYRKYLLMCKEKVILVEKQYNSPQKGSMSGISVTVDTLHSHWKNVHFEFWMNLGYSAV